MKFELEPYNRNISDDILIQDVIEVAKRLGRGTLTRQEYNSYGKYSANTLQRRFKSWIKVLERANLEESCPRRGMENEELFNNLKDVWITLGRQPKGYELKKPLSKYHKSTYENRFGTCRNALEAFVTFINDDSSEESNIYEEQAINVQFPENTNNSKLKQRTKRNISERLRFSILLRDGFRCQSCGRSPINSPGIELQVDHVLP